MTPVYRPLLKSDLRKWESLARSEFASADFCDAKYLLERWDKLKGFVLQTPRGEWIGVAILDFSGNKYNDGGCHILEVVLFPKYRNSAYILHLGKIIFENAKGHKKSASVRPKNRAPTGIMRRLGFENSGREWYWLGSSPGLWGGIIPGFWNVWTCSPDFYPKILRKVKLKLRS